VSVRCSSGSWWVAATATGAAVFLLVFRLTNSVANVAFSSDISSNFELSSPACDGIVRVGVFVRSGRVGDALKGAGEATTLNPLLSSRQHVYLGTVGPP
jgi:hypothetical protein